MGFEARQALLDVLDAAIADHKAKVCVIAYDLNEPEVVSRLKKLGKRLRIIVDDSDAHGEPGSAETQAAGELADSAGDDNVQRQHVLNLQHNKMFVVDGPKGKTVVCGSTNFSWRGFYVQNNNALVLRGATAVGRVPRGVRGLLARTAEGLRRHGLGELDGPRPAGYRRPGRVLTALRLERPARDHRRRPRQAHDLVAALLAGVPLPDARPGSHRDPGPDRTR